MRFLALYTPDKSDAGVPPTKEHIERMGKFVDEMFKSGALIATGGLLPASQSFRVKSADGRMTILDGPFAEAKEAIGGFAILEARSKEDVIEMTQRFLKVAGGGQSELRPIMDAPPQAR